jgi:hypothetical protein
MLATRACASTRSPCWETWPTRFRPRMTPDALSSLRLDLLVYLILVSFLISHPCLFLILSFSAQNSHRGTSRHCLPSGKLAEAVEFFSSQSNYKQDTPASIKALKDKPFVLKEGCKYKIEVGLKSLISPSSLILSFKVSFRVQHEIVSGLCFTNSVYKGPIKVSFSLDLSQSLILISLPR